MLEFSNTLGSSYLHMFKMYDLVQIRGLVLTAFSVDRTCFVHLCCTSQESEEQLAQRPVAAGRMMPAPTTRHVPLAAPSFMRPPPQLNPAMQHGYPTISGIRQIQKDPNRSKFFCTSGLPDVFPMPGIQPGGTAPLPTCRGRVVEESGSGCMAREGMVIL